MKVRVIKKPRFDYGGSPYDPQKLSIPGIESATANILKGGADFTRGAFDLDKKVEGIKDTNPGMYTAYNYLTNNGNAGQYFTTPASGTTASGNTAASGTTAKKDNGNISLNTPIQFNKTYGSTPVSKVKLDTPIQFGSLQNGGYADDSLINDLRSYMSDENDVDLDDLASELMDGGMSYDDAYGAIQAAMNPQFQMGGGNAGMFAGQTMGQPSQEPYVIKKPVMKEGGHTFVTSQPAYTKKSHTYFGTSNAPARDSYVNNDPVTTTVKAVPREDATIEAEKGEYIFSDGGLYKILGKKHYEGGTPLAAKGGEFIFSAHRDMSLDPKLLKEANLKTSSSKALADHVPAKVLEKNVDVKQYNRLKAIVNNPKSDEITKKTAQFMLEKMDEKIKTIADLQEAKKQPKPVQVEDQYLEQSEVDKDINEQKQYAHGGLTKFQTAGETQEEVTKKVIEDQIDKTLQGITDPKLKQKAETLVAQNLNYSPEVRLKVLNNYIRQGGVRMFDTEDLNPIREGDPRATADIEKIIPFYGEDANGFLDWFGAVMNSGVKSVNNIITGEYELPSQTITRELPGAPPGPTIGTGVLADVALDPLFYNTIGKITKLSMGVTPAMEAARAYQTGTKIGRTAMEVAHAPLKYIGMALNWLPKGAWKQYGYVATPFVLNKFASSLKEGQYIEEIRRLQNKVNKTEEDYNRIDTLNQELGAPAGTVWSGQDVQVTEPEANSKPTTTASTPVTPTTTAPPAKTNIDSVPASSTEYPIRKTDGTIDPDNVRVIKFNKQGLKVFDGIVPKKQFGGYFAYGGLNQYQDGSTNTQPTYFNDPKTGLRVGVNKQGAPGLYRGDKSIFDVYYNPKDFSATGQPISYQGAGNKPDYAANANELSDLVKGLSEAGIDLSNVNSAADLQRLAYDWTLKNNPEALAPTWEGTGLNNYQYKANPKIEEQLKALGVTLTPGVDGKKIISGVKGMAPENAIKVYQLLAPGYADNMFGYRSLGAFKPKENPKPEPNPEPKPKPEPEPEKKPEPLPEVKPEPKPIPVKNINYIPPQRPMSSAPWQLANEQLAYEYLPTYTPDRRYFLETPQLRSNQALKEEFGRQEAGAQRTARMFGDSTGAQLAAGQRMDAMTKGLQENEAYNTQAKRAAHLGNLERETNAVNAFAQDARRTHDQNQLARYKTNIEKAASMNRYLTAMDKDKYARYNASLAQQRAMIPYGSVDANGTVRFPIGPNGQFDPQWSGWNTNAVNSLSNQDEDAVFEKKVKRFNELRGKPGFENISFKDLYGTK